MLAEFRVPEGLDGHALECHNEEDGAHLGHVEGRRGPDDETHDIVEAGDAQDEQQDGLLHEGQYGVVQQADDVQPDEALCWVLAGGDVVIVDADEVVFDCWIRQPSV